MFDTTKIIHSHQYGPSNINVTEKRAPTDESVRLLKDMEKAARDKVIASIELDSNLVKGRVYVMKDYMSGKNNFAVLMDINGKRVEIKVSTNEYDSPDAQLHEVYQEIGKQIALEVMPAVFDSTRKELLFKNV
jgi:hypothetical protein